ncbi:glycosyl hydrolase family 8 [Paenibacillus elgii]
MGKEERDEMRLAYVTVALLVMLMAAALLLAGGPFASNALKGKADDPESRSDRLPGEIFIRRHMVNADGTLKTNLKPQAAASRDVAQGEESLSESMGLWLQYAVQKGDKTLFEQNVGVLQDRFLKDDGWIYWKVGASSEAVSTNALIDDLRIADALYKAGSRWDKPAYTALADTISGSIAQNMVTNEGRFSDFYDHASVWKSNVLTLSYLQVSAFKVMYERGKLSEPVYTGAVDFLKNLPTRDTWFPFSYDSDKGTYLYNDEINWIDQLYIVYHRAQAGIPSDEVWSLLKEQFNKYGVLYGRYHAQSKLPAVDFESPAAYGLAILSAVELGDRDFAQTLYYRMLRFQILNPANEWYGGFVFDDDTHIFDNLVPLLAERKMYDEGLLR